MKYSEKLKDPRWQKKRLKIMERDEWSCVRCGNKTETLNVHHLAYTGEPWDAPDSDLETVCESCHKKEHAPFRPWLDVKESMVSERPLIHVWLADLLAIKDEEAETVLLFREPFHAICLQKHWDFLEESAGRPIRLAILSNEMEKEVIDSACANPHPE